MKKVLTANHGEIAPCVLHACREMGIITVAVYSEADKDGLHVKLIDGFVCIGSAASAQSYLNIPAITAIVEVAGVDSIHPGYGFLARSTNFAEQVEQSGSTFIGPRAETIRLMSDEVSTRHATIETGIPCVSGSDDALPGDPAEILKTAGKVGYPVIIRVSGGGGGRSMRVIERREGLIKSVEMTKTETGAAFGNPMAYMERYLQCPYHVEIQVPADEHGNAIYLTECDCSLQHRHQKVIEKAPVLFITAERREKIGQTCADTCKRIDYHGAGTLEFLYEDDEFFFIEMNARVQVEHPVIELIINVDIVQEQIRITGDLLLQYRQRDIKVEGHAFECRINAEDPCNFIPSPGLTESCHLPGGFDIRMDSHIYQGYHISSYYGSLTDKVCVIDKIREQAMVKMCVTLVELAVIGIKTNTLLHRDLFDDQGLQEGGVSIHYLEYWLEKHKERKEKETE